MALFTYRCWESEKSADAELWHRTGQRCTVLYELPPDKVDIEDVGRMFRVQFSDGFEYDVFSDELEL